MQTATALVSLGGDHRNQVPKVVTPAEIEVLRAIHGGDAVTNIDPHDEEIDRSSSEEIARLRAIYVGRDDDGNKHVDLVYPGRAVALPQAFEDLDLPEDFYKAVERVAPKPKADKSAPKRTTRKPAAKKTAAKKDDEGDVSDVMS